MIVHFNKWVIKLVVEKSREHRSPRDILLSHQLLTSFETSSHALLKKFHTLDDMIINNILYKIRIMKKNGNRLKLN